MKYNKKPISIADQIAQLKSRGLIIEDENNAEKVLSIISYFRFVNYLRPMEEDKVTHKFKPGKKFSNALDLYYFDKTLRSVLFSAIQTVEIALRTSVIQHFSIFKDGEMHKACLKTIKTELKRTKEDFINEHFAKYDRPSMPPSWKTLEVVSFGTLGKLYSNFADTSIKKTVARSFNVPNHEVLDSWIAALAALRNCCAHHARTWNRRYPWKPKMPATLPLNWISNALAVRKQKLYAQLCCLAYMCQTIVSTSDFKGGLKALLAKYPKVNPTALGFPPLWDQEPLWR